MTKSWTMSKIDYAALFWIALLGSLMCYVQVPIGGAARLINISLYEIAVPVLLLITLVARQTPLPSTRFILIIATAVILLGTHAALSFYVFQSIDKAAFLKEAIKTMAFPIYL